jgi:DNA-directed RNA polymerase subunit RPC12/RpoP
VVNFTCPTCKTLCAHTTPGEKVYCPKCGQKLLVPAAVAAPKTVLGEWQPTTGAPAAPVTTATPAGAVPPWVEDARALSAIPLLPPVPVLPAPAPASGRAVRPRVRRGDIATFNSWLSRNLLWLIPVVLLGSVLMVGGVSFLAKPPAPPPPNACCLQCRTPLHIDDLERMTYYQQLAIEIRCPACGLRAPVYVFALMTGRARPHPPDSPSGIIMNPKGEFPFKVLPEGQAESP